MGYELTACGIDDNSLLRMKLFHNIISEMANFLYHAQPTNFVGDILVPLNELKMAHPQIYTTAFEKYLGRENLTKVFIPILNCFWNDVIHLSPIHPRAVREGLENIGGKVSGEQKWFKIPPSRLKDMPAVYYENKPSNFGGPYTFAVDCFRPFDEQRYQELDKISDLTLAYYKKEFEQKRKPFIFNGIQHILVQGHIDISGLELISW